MTVWCGRSVAGLKAQSDRRQPSLYRGQQCSKGRRFKAHAEKGMLVRYAPDNTLVSEMPDTRRAILREWLGRRLGREAVSDDDSSRIVEPIPNSLEEVGAD
jgi:hypothetical protein